MSDRSARAYVDLAVTLIVREIVVRYKRSVLGLAWALIEPLANVAVYYVVFGVFMKAAEHTPNYAMYTLCGLLPWLFLSSTLEQGAGVLLEHAPLLRKIAFPRELLVIAVVVSRLTTLLAGLVLVLIGGLVVDRPPRLEAVPWLLLGLFDVVALVTGLSFAIAALQVLLRDTSFLVRFILKIGFYATPIVYTMRQVPDEFQVFFSLNPLVGVLWCFQALATPAAAPPAACLVATVGALLVLVLGWGVFRALLNPVADRL